VFCSYKAATRVISGLEFVLPIMIEQLFLMQKRGFKLCAKASFIDSNTLFISFKDFVLATCTNWVKNGK
jgi:hypothetical protein